MYPGAHAMAEQASAQNAGTLLGIQFGTIVPGQANATSQTPVRESVVIVWYEQWLRAHRWAMLSDRGPASAGGIRFDRCITFRRGTRENYLLFVHAFPGGTLIHTNYGIDPFSIVRVFA